MQNEARRRRRQNSELADLLEMLADVQNDIPSPPNAEVLQAIIEEAQRALYQDEWKTCAVCDEEAELPLPGEGTLFRAFNVLQPRPDHTFTDELMSQTTCPAASARRQIKLCFKTFSCLAVSARSRGLLNCQLSKIQAPVCLRILPPLVVTVKMDKPPRTINCRRFARKTPSQT